MLIQVVLWKMIQANSNTGVLQQIKDRNVHAISPMNTYPIFNRDSRASLRGHYVFDLPILSLCNIFSETTNHIAVSITRDQWE